RRSERASAARGRSNRAHAVLLSKLARFSKPARFSNPACCGAQLARLLRVRAALRADAARAAAGRLAAARPPILPPLRDAAWLVFLPRPEPLFLPPCDSLLTVAHARRAASPAL